MSSSAPASTSCTLSSRSSPTGAARLRRCCCRRPGGWRDRRRPGARDLPGYGQRRDVRRPSGRSRRRRAARWPARRGAAPPAHAPRAPDLLLDGLVANFSEGYAAGLPILQQALSAFGREMSAAEELRWLWLACIAALHLWDDERWDVLSRRHVELARERRSARRASAGPQLSRVHAAVRRRADCCGVAGRGGAGGDGRDREQPGALRRPGPGGLAWRGKTRRPR